MCLEHNRPLKFYFLGIGGSAMGQAALLLHNQGHIVSGADQNVYPPMSVALQKSKIDYSEGYNYEAVIKYNPDFIIIGNALSRGNPIIETLLNTQDYPILSLPELIAQFLIQKRPCTVITGTHGKTTTTAATAYFLTALKQQPGYLMGGVPHLLPSGATLGHPQSPFIIEGDEYDSAFFDKRSKFIHYKPRILSIGNLEFDHADIFRDLDDIKRTFRHLIRLVPSNGAIIYNKDDAVVESLFPVSWTQHYSVGCHPLADLHLSQFKESPSGITFNLTWQGQSWGTIHSPLQGLFNAYNLAMAILNTALTIEIKTPQPFDFEIVKNFKGVKRRQEIHAKNPHWTLIEDFAHHPTAIEKTLRSLKNTHPKARIWAIFEPRSNTTATNVFQDTLPNALKIADFVSIAPIYRENHIPPENRLDTEKIAEALRTSKKSCTAYKDYENLSKDLTDAIQNATGQDPHTLLILLSNGNCGELLPQLIPYIDHEGNGGAGRNRTDA